MKRSFYEEFPDVTKKEWLEKIESDLKGKSAHDLNKELSKEWEISPFFSKEDLENKSPVQNQFFSESLIAQSFSPRDADTPELLQDALANGVQSVIFEKVDDIHKLKTLVQAEQWKYVVPVFYFKETIDTAAFNEFIQEAKVAFIKQSDHQEGDFYKNVKSRAFQLDADPAKEMPASLADFIYAIVQLLDHCEENKAEDLLKSCWIEVEQGKNYYLEIARLRAIRILWANLLQNYGLDKNIPLPIIANVGEAVDQKDPYRNMIAYTVAGINAIIAGADITNIAPIGDRNNKFSKSAQRRVARNIQNIAQLESHLDKVVDPAAGSYAFESISRQLAQKAWQLFLEKTGSPAS